MSGFKKRNPAGKSTPSLGRAEAMPRSRPGIATAGASLRVVGNQAAQAVLRGGLGGVADREEHEAKAVAAPPSSLASRPVSAWPTR